MATAKKAGKIVFEGRAIAFVHSEKERKIAS